MAATKGAQEWRKTVSATTAAEGGGRTVGRRLCGSALAANEGAEGVLGLVRCTVVLQSAQFCRSESEQNAIRTESYWPAAPIRPNGWLRVRRDCVLFRPRQAKLSRLQYLERSPRPSVRAISAPNFASCWKRSTSLFPFQQSPVSERNCCIILVNTPDSSTAPVALHGSQWPEHACDGQAELGEDNCDIVWSQLGHYSLSTKTRSLDLSIRA